MTFTFFPTSNSYKCQYCNYSVTDGYCSTCRSHFTIQNNIQKYLRVEMDDLEYITIKDRLCPKCLLYYNTSNVIRCTSFIDYFKKLPFCFKCKNDNIKFIRNMFYKDFLLYKSRENIFSSIYLLLFLFLFSFFGDYLVFYIFYFVFNFLYLSIYESILSFLFLGRRYFFIRWVYFITNLYIMINKKRYFFYIPINLEKERHIEKHIKDLVISK